MAPPEGLPISESVPPPADEYIELPLGVHEERAAAMFVPDPEIVEEYRPVFWEKVNEALATAVNSHERDSILRTAHIIEWAAFRPDAPVPEGLVISEGLYDLREIRHDSRLAYRSTCYDAAMDRLLNVGIKKAVFDPVERHIEARSGAMRAAWEAGMYESAVGRFVRSFDVEAPADPADRPLPPRIRDEREQRIIRAARDFYKMPDTERLQRRINPGPVKRANQGIQYLDEETIRLPEETQSADDARTRAKRYFGGLLAETFESREDQRMANIITAPNGEVQIVGEADGESRPLVHYVAEAAGDLVARLSPDLPDALTGVYELFVADFLLRLWESPGSYRDIVAQSAHATSGHIVRATTDLSRVGFDDETMMQLRHRPHGRYVESDQITAANRLHRHCDFFIATKEAGFVSRGELERAKQVTVAFVRTPFDGPARIIQMLPRDRSIPEHTNVRPDLVLSVYREFDDADPFIPGYRLVSREFYGDCRFVRDPDGDPYAPIPVTLDEAQRQRLQEMYQGIGLEALAAFVGNTPRLTVSELQIAIKGNSIAVEPEDDEDGLPRDFNPEQFSDFAPLVSEGKIQGQCTSADLFYKMSLEEVFGKGCTASVAGFVMDDYGSVSSLQHQQTVFAYGGRVYISDATPFSNRPHEREMPPVMPDTTMYEEAPRSYRIDLPEPPPSGETMPIDPAARRKQLLANTRTAFEAQLMIVLNAPDTQAVYEAVARLPEHDPLRRTMETVFAATREGVSEGELRSLWRYLRQVGEANDLTLQEMKLRVYDSQLITDMQNILGQIAHAEGYGTLGVSVEGIIGQMEAALAQLPHEELAISGESLARAITLLTAMESTDMQGSLYTAQEALQQARQQLHHAAESLDHYRKHIAR